VKTSLLFLMGLACLACCGCPQGSLYVEGDPRVRVSTTVGEFVIELNQEKAPISVHNFLQYVQDGFYEGTIFHRVVPAFVVQGGGFLPGLEPKPTRDPIASEANNGLKNLRGTVGMARADNAASAASQFYINLVDNASLDASLTSPGYAVFGYVVAGMDVIDQIAAVPTGQRGDFSDVPVNDVVIQSATIEPGEQVLSPQWDTYFKEYQYDVETGLRNLLVSVLGSFITSR
jgi:peptidyl-prolyl cis-trans isomerase A (cyclophilin A)